MARHRSLTDPDDRVVPPGRASNGSGASPRDGLGREFSWPHGTGEQPAWTVHRSLLAIELTRLDIDLVDTTRLDASQLATLDQIRAGIDDLERTIRRATRAPDGGVQLAALADIADILWGTIEAIQRLRLP